MKSWSRRAVIGAASLALPFFRALAAHARDYLELAAFPPVPVEYIAIASEPPMNEEFGNSVEGVGTLKASDSQKQVASEIIAMATNLKGIAPVEIAGFLLDVAAGEYDLSWPSYTRAWPKDAPANPLILDFFESTATKPEGDTTAWCAAFVNWCLIKANGSPYPSMLTQPTRSAASGSFRSWGQRGMTYSPEARSLLSPFQPEVGDLAVFQRMRPSGKPDPTRGHVGFFLDMDKDRVKVLGGNQFEGKPVVHAINVKWLPKQGGTLWLHSIRSDLSLRRR